MNCFSNFSLEHEVGKYFGLSVLSEATLGGCLIQMLLDEFTCLQEPVNVYNGSLV